MSAKTKQRINPLQELSSRGQSVWLDYITRSLLSSGDLDRMIEHDGLLGMTSNPAIFEKAIANGTDYTEALDALRDQPGLDTATVFERLAVEDIRHAADHFAPTWRASGQRDGYVSLEVSPRLADDTEATYKEAHRLWHEVDRPNLMIKVPATAAGIPAIEALIADGINVNITLLFSVEVYKQVAEAWMRGLEARAQAGKPLTGIASVASFFISRIDSAVDAQVHAWMISRSSDQASAQHNPATDIVSGKVAIANAKIAYQHYLQIISSKRWHDLANNGAQSQRLLWASTSTKNPDYRDVLYVEELIGQDTVTTLPPATMDAFRDHGTIRVSLTEAVEEAGTIIRALPDYGVDLDAVTGRLLNEGVAAFSHAYEQLLETIAGVLARDRRQHRLARLDLPAALQQDVDSIISDFAEHDKLTHMWRRDKSLWTGQDENHWLDWLTVTATQLEHQADLRNLTHLAEGGYFRHAVLLGMGGSSLAAELFALSFSHRPSHPELIILDSTDPEQIRVVEALIDPARTLFIVASKSGATMEPNLLLDYFFDHVAEAIGKQHATDHFGVITDHGSSLETRARELGFRKIFYGQAGIGGRYSALSCFGMVPAAVAGIDTGRLLRQAQTMADACVPDVAAVQNPGLQLGAVLGAGWQQGYDKITLLCSPPINALGAWLEQLLAESTGKQCKALIPVAGEKPATPEHYGNDRLFVYLRLSAQADAEQEQAVADLRAAGHPVVQIDIDDNYTLGAELFRWEFATAIAGSVMSVNAFNQPDVEAAKQATRSLTDTYQNDQLVTREPVVADKLMQLFAADNYIQTLAGNRELADATELLSLHIDQLSAGDYFAMLAYMNRMDTAYYVQLQRLRHVIRDSYRVATCLGYGPRYLHSTGQAYKGGPNTGVFLMITRDIDEDLAIPNHRHTFGAIESAQAEGDFVAMADRSRRILRLHLKGDHLNSLITLESLIQYFETDQRRNIE